MESLWVHQARKGDVDAFVKLIEKHKMSLYKTAKCYLKCEDDVADIIQDTVLLAFEHIKELKHPVYFKTWLIRICINRCLSLLREQKKYQTVEWTEDFAYTEKDDREFYELLQMLPEDYRMIFLLYYSEGLNSREIAEILELNENTVKSRLKRGRKKLKQALCF